MLWKSVCLPGIGLCLALTVGAEIVELKPVADTTLHEISPGNNMGRHSHVAIGSTAKSTAARGLFRFDVSAIPANAVVSQVSLTFELPPLGRVDTGGSLYSAHRVLKGWGEGTKAGSLGMTATEGEASWNHAAMPIAWSTPGGQAGTDYEATASATETIGPAPGVYTMRSTTGLIADVQHWVANPERNFGWLLKVDDETIAQTARQFASRETTNAPILRVEFSVSGAGELRITTIERADTNVVIRWTGGQGNVAVETSTTLPGTWVRVGASESGVFTNSVQAGETFVRLKDE
jgi:hypothetical protein